MSGRQLCLAGIAGATASGKTTIAMRTAALLGGCARCICLDRYYRDLAQWAASERAAHNFDAPGALDWPLLLAHLDALVAGKSVAVPQYDFKEHVRRDATDGVAPAPVLLIEGIHALSHPPLLTRFDLKVFVDTPPDLCFIRRLERDTAERGRDADSVVRQYREHVRPMYARHIAPARAEADLVVSGEGCERAAAVVAAAIAARLER